MIHPTEHSFHPLEVINLESIFACLFRKQREQIVECVLPVALVCETFESDTGTADDTCSFTWAVVGVLREFIEGAHIEVVVD